MTTTPTRPARSARLGAAAVALLAVPALAACGSGPVPGVPSGTETVCGAPVPASDVTLDGLTEQDVLMVVGSFALESHVVYDDGRVAIVGSDELSWERSIRAADDDADDGEADDDEASAAAANASFANAAAVVVPAMAWMPHPTSPYLVVGQLSDCALVELDRLAQELTGVWQRTGGDLGAPPITDQSSTSIDYHGESAVEASAYALTSDFQDGLNRTERTGRALMRAMLDTVNLNLPDVRELPPPAFESYPGGSTSCEPVTEPADVEEILVAFEEDVSSQDVGARAVPPGITPCT